MNIDTELLLCAVGLAFLLEGVPWALFPEGMRRVMQNMVNAPMGQLRCVGLCAMGLGLLFVWLARN